MGEEPDTLALQLLRTMRAAGATIDGVAVTDGLAYCRSGHGAKGE
jgi:hypothetical protein